MFCNVHAKVSHAHLSVFDVHVDGFWPRGCCFPIGKCMVVVCGLFSISPVPPFGARFPSSSSLFQVGDDFVALGAFLGASFPFMSLGRWRAHGMACRRKHCLRLRGCHLLGLFLCLWFFGFFWFFVFFWFFLVLLDPSRFLGGLKQS